MMRALQPPFSKALTAFGGTFKSSHLTRGSKASKLFGAGYILLGVAFFGYGVYGSIFGGHRSWWLNIITGLGFITFTILRLTTLPHPTIKSDRTSSLLTQKEAQ